MSDIVDKTVARIARGAFFVLIGIIAGYFFNFVIRILIVRHLIQSDYGIYSLGFAIINICLILALLGMDIGIPRQIAFYRGKGEDHYHHSNG